MRSLLFYFFLVVVSLFYQINSLVLDGRCLVLIVWCGCFYAKWSLSRAKWERKKRAQQQQQPQRSNSTKLRNCKGKTLFNFVFVCVVRWLNHTPCAHTNDRIHRMARTSMAERERANPFFGFVFCVTNNVYHKNQPIEQCASWGLRARRLFYMNIEENPYLSAPRQYIAFLAHPNFSISYIPCLFRSNRTTVFDRSGIFVYSM